MNKATPINSPTALPVKNDVYGASHRLMTNGLVPIVPEESDHEEGQSQTAEK